MPCEDCPEIGALQSAPETFCIAYGGGPETTVYALVGQAIPARDERVILQYGWPSVGNDGTITYVDGQEPPLPEGYERTTTGMRPCWPSCVWRLLRVRFQNHNGSLQIDGLCNHVGSGQQLGRPITVLACQGCPVRKPIPD